MKRKTAAVVWPIVAIVAIFALGFLAALTVAGQEGQREAAPARPATSAAGSVIAVLLGIILALALAAGGAALASRWWKRRERRDKLEDALFAAQIYALLSGARLPGPRGSGPSPPQGGPSVFVVGGGHQYPQPGLTLEDLTRALEAAQGRRDPLADLMPPDSGGWEVLG